MGKVIFDLDGTLSIPEHRMHFIKCDKPDWDKFYDACDKDLPNKPIIEICKALHNQGHYIFIFTGRNESAEDKTLVWLKKYGIVWSMVQMRPRKNYTPDYELKKAWAEKLLERHDVLCAFEDRARVVKMYRELGIPCLQVSEGDF